MYSSPISAAMRVAAVVLPVPDSPLNRTRTTPASFPHYQGEQQVAPRSSCLPFISVLDFTVTYVYTSYNVSAEYRMAQKRVLSMRLPDGVRETIERMARRERRTSAEMAALLLEEKVRERTHPTIVFRDTAVGRQASVRGTRL